MQTAGREDGYESSLPPVTRKDREAMKYEQNLKWDCGFHSFYHNPRIFHQGKPTPIQMTILRKEMSSPNFHQVFWSTYPALK